MTEGDRVSRWVEAYVGFDRSASPLNSWVGLAEQPPAPDRELAESVVTALQQLRPDWSADGLDDDLDAGARWAREEMRTRFPWLTASALDALERSFAFDWR